jgi:hypothetical protein
MKRCKNCPLLRYCLTQKAEWDTCDDMVRKFNANLLLPPVHLERSSL